MEADLSHLLHARQNSTSAEMLKFLKSLRLRCVCIIIRGITKTVTDKQVFFLVVGGGPLSKSTLTCPHINILVKTAN